LTKWRVGVRRYAVALLGAPLLSIAVLATLAFVSTEFVPRLLVTDDKATLLLLGISVGAVAGFFEELGWTGFAVHHLKTRHGITATGLIVGVLWSAWHVLVVGLRPHGQPVHRDADACEPYRLHPNPVAGYGRGAPPGFRRVSVGRNLGYSCHGHAPAPPEYRSFLRRLVARTAHRSTLGVASVSWLAILGEIVGGVQAQVMRS
jgi:Type II CAAX prenyl endopeptidase Rce1-like